jgi:hypothetical protein
MFYYSFEPPWREPEDIAWIQFGATVVIATATAIAVGGTSGRRINGWGVSDSETGSFEVFRACEYNGFLDTGGIRTVDFNPLDQVSGNLISNSLMLGGGSIPSGFGQPGATGTSVAVTSLINDGTGAVAYLQTATAQRPMFDQTLVVLPNYTEYCFSMEVEAVTGTVLAGNCIFVINAPTNAALFYPPCPANPNGSSAGVLTTGKLIVILSIAGYSNLTPIVRFGLGTTGAATGTLQFSRPMFTYGVDRTDFQPTNTTDIKSLEFWKSKNTLERWYLVVNGGGSGRILSSFTADTVKGFFRTMGVTYRPINSNFQTGWVAGGTTAITAAGVSKNGNPAGAYFLSDTDAGQQSHFRRTVTIANDSVYRTFAFSIFKDGNTSRVAAYSIQLTGGSTTVNRTLWINTATGETLVDPTSSSSDVSETVVNGVFTWDVYVHVANNSTGNTSMTCYIYPAPGTVLGTANLATTGGITVSQPMIYESFAGFVPHPLPYVNTDAGADVVFPQDRLGYLKSAFMRDDIGTAFAQISSVHPARDSAGQRVFGDVLSASTPLFSYPAGLTGATYTIANGLMGAV